MVTLIIVDGVIFFLQIAKDRAQSCVELRHKRHWHVRTAVEKILPYKPGSQDVDSFPFCLAATFGGGKVVLAVQTHSIVLATNAGSVTSQNCT